VGVRRAVGAALEWSGNGRAEFPPGEVISAGAGEGGHGGTVQTQLVGRGGR